MNNSIRAIASVCFASTIVTVTAIAPVWAGTKRDDGDDPGQGLGVQGAILWFVLLPLAISGIIALLVMGPGWVSAAKKSAPNGFLDDPTASAQPVSDKPEVASLTYE